MPDFDFEDMRGFPSPLEVLEQLTLPRQGLVRARVLDPVDENYQSVVGYGYMWNNKFDFDPTESERLKIIEFSLGETSCDATVALILNFETEEQEMQRRQEERLRRQTSMHNMSQQLIDMQRQHQRERETAILQNKKDSARIAILMTAELTDDAVDLIKAEVMTEHQELRFPDTTPEV